MSLVREAEQLRLLEHEAALTRGVPVPIPRRECIVCSLRIDPHPGRGRKPYTCGRYACRRKRINVYQLAWYYRQKNAKSRAEWWKQHPEAV